METTRRTFLGAAAGALALAAAPAKPAGSPSAVTSGEDDIYIPEFLVLPRGLDLTDIDFQFAERPNSGWVAWNPARPVWVRKWTGWRTLAGQATTGAQFYIGDRTSGRCWYGHHEIAWKDLEKTYEDGPEAVRRLLAEAKRMSWRLARQYAGLL